VPAIPRQQAYLAVYVLLWRDGRILALQRQNTGYMDGLWCPPAGGVDLGESVAQCAVRECAEEVGVSIDPDSLTLLHTMHRLTPERYVIDLFFQADFTGQPLNAEPHKAAAIEWVDPSGDWPWMTYIPQAFQHMQNDSAFSQFGFTQ